MFYVHVIFIIILYSIYFIFLNRFLDISCLCSAYIIIVNKKSR